ncbi:hypothetical protein BN1723_009451 [Verticillium longisporum]|uniref:Uncharacterized protein n=1 Tax=Verticillium longisporum TaxID=100787 RepID=A0A0G4KPD0_VERLO|nr:hypothetical protein BN1723_009451 [Verticillium longisporum]
MGKKRAHPDVEDILARPCGNLAAPPGLPQRPQNAGGYHNGGPTGQPGEVGDAIDQIIRDAELGNKTKRSDEADGGGGERKAKKGARMVYSDENVSPEERMSQLPRYAWVPPVS